MIHDLKNPLIPIMGYIRILLDEKVRSEESRIEKLKIIQKASKDLLLVIENTSKNLREKHALQSFHPEEVEYNDIVLSVIVNSMSEIDKRGIKILFNNKSIERWDETEKIILKADPYQLKTMVENLLGNAIKYAKGIIRVKLNKDNSGIRFSISDDGPGIPEIYLKKIFEPYFQTPGSKKGTGLGLYSVIKVIKNHKGEIFVNSALNNETSFEIILPCTSVQLKFE